MFDPLILRAIACSFALLFLLSALHKFSDAKQFRAILEEYRLLPEMTIAPLSHLIPVAEVALALIWIASLKFGQLTNISAIGSATLLAIYTSAIVLNIKRGRIHIDCGCTLSGATDSGQQLSTGLVVRNSALIILALAATVNPSYRTLGLFDFIILGAGLLTSIVLYSAANQLLSNGDAIGTWRNRHD